MFGTLLFVVLLCVGIFYIRYQRNQRNLDRAPLLDDRNVEDNRESENSGNPSNSDANASSNEPNISSLENHESDFIRSIYNPVPRVPVPSTFGSSQPFTGTRPKEPRTCEGIKDDGNDASQVAVQKLHPAPTRDDQQTGIPPLEPNPPFSSYFEGAQADQLPSGFDRTLYEGIKDTPPMIRKAKQIIAKYQNQYKVLRNKE